MCNGRVAKKLLELADAHGVKTDEGIIIDYVSTQQELASMVGASRESVNKVLGYFTIKKLHQYSANIASRFYRVNDLKRRIY